MSNQSESRSLHSTRPNQLLNATSPYLRQHAYNPVDWREWNEEGLATAKVRDLPIFLSIGYAACHWCHVMERESFENEVIANFLNEHFVCIKVDREERPDLDHLYMTFTQAMTGSGGWPMSVWLTPDLKPFYSGTYFPPEDHFGRPGFLRLLAELSRLWTQEREQIFASAEEITGYIREHMERVVAPSPLSDDLLPRAAEGWMRRYDCVHGGFGAAPKFQHPTELNLLLRAGQRSAVVAEKSFTAAARHSLEQLVRGGIYDQIGGGFHRYSVDEYWLVPHFEKMLYDNALLLSVMAECSLLQSHDELTRAIDQTILFLKREMRDDSGGFYSGIDADSEGVEGKFYVWSADEFSRRAGENAEKLREYFQVTPAGNFEGHSILNRNAASLSLIESGVLSYKQIDSAIASLLIARENRIRPTTDTKLLASWNGLLIAALVDCAVATGNESYGSMAVDILDFVQHKLWDGEILSHGLSNGRLIPGEQLEDYAYLLFGLTRALAADSILRLSLERRTHLYHWGAMLADRAMRQFMDNDGRCFLRPSGTTDLLIRPQENTDGALPSPVGQLARGLIQLSRFTGETRFKSAAEKILHALSGELTKYPDGMASLVLAYDELARPSVEVVMIGSYDQSALTKIVREYSARGVLCLHSLDGQHPSPLFDGRRTQMQQVYVCSDNVCHAPVGKLEQARDLIEQKLQ